MTTHHRPTIKDVARRAGVSKATVSRVLNGTTYVAPSTAEAVRTAIKEVGYSASWQARALARGSAEAIGIVFSEDFEHFGADPTFHRQMQGIFSTFGETPYTPIILHASTLIDQDKACKLIDSHLFDAVIHLTPYEDHGVLQALADSDTPTVLCSQLPRNPWQAKFSTVYADDVAGGVLAAQHMHDIGVAEPIILTGPMDNPATVERVEGTRRVYPNLEENRVLHLGWDETAGEMGMLHFLTAELEFDGVICGSDRIAAGALKALQRENIDVPGQVCVIGFDDHPVATQTKPALTTIAQPMGQEGRRAAELALALINGAGPIIEQLPMTLKRRSTT